MTIINLGPMNVMHRRDEATYSRVLQKVTAVIAQRRGQDFQDPEQQVKGWNICKKHEAIIEVGVTLRSATGYVVSQVLLAEREDVRTVRDSRGEGVDG